MSSYEYTDKIGDKLQVSSNGYGGATLVAEGKSGLRRKTILIEHEDVPAVAAELLKAAGQESVIVPRSTKPVEVRQFDQLRCGDAATHAEEAPAKLRGLAADFIAIAEYIESKAIREADAEKKLQERRDALSFQLNGGGVELLWVPYANRTATMRQAIDRIIELEDGK